MRTKHPLRTWLKQNDLSIVLFVLFFIFLFGLALTGHNQQNQELASHHQAAISLAEYLRSGEFIEAIFENWESEFLQMAALVILTIFLRQRGSADSKKLSGKEEVDIDSSSRISIIRSHSFNQSVKQIRHFLYKNSLSIALILLFIISITLHAIGGTATYNNEATLHGEEQISTLAYITTSQFWFESFQNWQSEFLAVGILLVLSVFLRQQGSPESKPVKASDTKTGS